MFCFSADSESLSSYDLVILHTAEAQEWAAYLQQILNTSRKFRKQSILMYAVGPDDQVHGYNFEYFHSCKCIVLLVTGALIDSLLCDPELHEALQRLLYPSHRVVALLCGMPEDDILTESFEDWPNWRKLYTEDEPALYVSTILEAIADSTSIVTNVQVSLSHLCQVKFSHHASWFLFCIYRSDIVLWF